MNAAFSEQPVPIPTGVSGDQLSCTVDDLLTATLPAGTQLLAGELGLGRQVTWAVAQRSGLPAFPSLKGGEIVLVSVPALALVQDAPSLAQTLQQLAGRGVAAVAVLGDIPTHAVEAANALSMPLLALPAETNLRELESSLSRAVTERQLHWHRLAAQARRRFTDLTLSGRGLPAILDALSEITSQRAVLSDRHGDLLGQSPADGTAKALPPELTEALASGTGTGAGLSAPTVHRVLLSRGGVTLVTPVSVRGDVVGYLALVGSPDAMGGLSRQTMLEAAAACSVEFARSVAVSEVESRYRGGFLDRLLAGEYSTTDEIALRGRGLGYDPTRPYVVAMTRLEEQAGLGDGKTDSRGACFRESVAASCLHCLFHQRDGYELVLIPLADGFDEAAAAAALNGARKLAEAQTGASATLAWAGPNAGPGGAALSFRQARWALAVAKSLLGDGRTVAYRDLWPYTLLRNAGGDEEYSTAWTRTLRPLVEYDEKTGGELLPTLEAYFAHDGSLEGTADSLKLHRNSLAYRLRRVLEIGGLDVRRSDDSLRLQLALKALRLTQLPALDP